MRRFASHIHQSHTFIIQLTIIGNMGKKSRTTSFASGIGKHNLRSLGEDIGFGTFLKDFSDSTRKQIKAEDFVKHSRTMLNTGTLSDIGIRVASGVTLKLVENGLNSLTNGEKPKWPLISSNHKTTMGKSSAVYLKTRVHIGRPTSKRLINMKNNPNVDYDEKVLASTNKDYRSHEKRKNLSLKAGFNEKGFTFLMEDTFLTANNYLKLFNTENKIQKLLDNSKTKTDLYGCIYKTKHNFKFMNKLDFYNLTIKLHLVKITDQHKSVRDLIVDTTNNKEMLNTENIGSLKDKAKKVKETIKDKEERLKTLAEFLKKERDELKYGKILEDDQFTDPDTYDLRNRIAINFLTKLKCNLTDSIRFNDEARIVHTWTRELTPGSIWDFGLTHHLGKGIHLNKLNDFNKKNVDHPSGYVFVLEYFGDKKGRIVRNKDKDFFTGYSPARIHVEFDTTLCYLYEFKNSTETPIFYRRKKSEADFEEGSPLETLFTPDREPDFHVKYSDIILNEHADKEAPYTLEYDINLMESGTNLMLKQIGKHLEDIGFDPDSATEDDTNYNLRGKDPKGVDDYHGTEGGEADIDLDALDSDE